MVSSDGIVTDNPKILHSGWTGVPPTQHISGRQFVEEGRVLVDALAFKDRDSALHERHISRVKVVRPKTGEDRGRVHSGNPTPRLPGPELDSLGRPLSASRPPVHPPITAHMRG